MTRAPLAELPEAYRCVECGAHGVRLFTPGVPYLCGADEELYCAAHFPEIWADHTRAPAVLLPSGIVTGWTDAAGYPEAFAHWQRLPERGDA